ncbi:hypothetical protein McpSp1_01840 [Methanocorpusculaceae archaeon Sp1]|uniref:Uncharacterized protein n=1 Tax=Methanorbis furvi TaxID=3028299 RepID=A0AAE4ME20_9EURY|nr:hypothetical protein [Methanocorpusculaceae archaeon Sp1]MDV0441808.1 hypothetical protein [Methanocorpusculaceae archaeon Ag1]
MKSETKEKIRSIFAEEGITSEITCEQASAICETYQIDPFHIGKYCDIEHIKFKHCKFGCFK